MDVLIKDVIRNLSSIDGNLQDLSSDLRTFEIEIEDRDLGRTEKEEMKKKLLGQIGEIISRIEDAEGAMSQYVSERDYDYDVLEKSGELRLVDLISRTSEEVAGLGFEMETIYGYIEDQESEDVGEVADDSIYDVDDIQDDLSTILEEIESLYQGANINIEVYDLTDAQQDIEWIEGLDEEDDE